jgi:hypothetical protein
MIPDMQTAVDRELARQEAMRRLNEVQGGR